LLNGAAVIFEDEVYFQQEGTTHQSWARRGEGFDVFHHPCKRKSKFYGAIAIDERPSFAFQKANWFNSKTFQRFLERLLAIFDRISLILDNVKYHKAKRLDSFLETNRDRLWLHPLPPYSPDLNAIEVVWRETRKDATHNRYFPTIKGVTRAVQTQFRTYQSEPQKLASLIGNFL